MIPIKLEFQAFGPYIKKQLIDFTLFENDRIFLISGQTGSGKTTIFDAITFALFGQPSGSIRSVEHFKSQFVDDSICCYVRFEFTVNGESFTVYREPQQFKIKRNSNISKALPIAELTMPNGEMITSINAVNDKIKLILGIDCEQFKKIAMLPQGEFRKFLSEKTTSKQNTLREIFKTDLYDSFTKKLSEKANLHKQMLADINNIIQGSIDNINYYDNEQLKESCVSGAYNAGAIHQLLNSFNKQLSKKLAKIEVNNSNLQNDITRLNLPYHKEVNQTFTQLDIEKEKLTELSIQNDFFYSRVTYLERLKIIKEIIPTYNLINETKSSINALDLKLNDYEKQKKTYENDINELSPKLKSAQKKSATVISIATDIEKLNQQFEMLEKSDLIKQNIIVKNNELVKKKLKIDQLNSYMISLELKEEQNIIVDNINRLENAHSLLNKFNTLLVEYKNTSSEYKLAFDSFLSSQAFILSETLIRGVPCPVCGSLDHPSPPISVNNIITVSMLDEIKLKFDEITQQVERNKSECIVALGACGISDFVKAPNLIEQQLTIISNKKDELFIQINKLDLMEFGYSKDETRQLVEETNRKIIIDEQTVSDLSNRLSEIATKIDCNYKDKQAVFDAINSKKEEIDIINGTVLKFANEFASLNDLYVRCQEAIKQATEYKANYLVELDKQEKSFEKSLKINDISISQFESLMLEIVNIDAITAEIDLYTASVSTSKARVDSLSEMIVGKEAVNLTALQEKFDEIQQTIELNKILVDELVPVISINTSISQTIAKNIIQFDEIEKKYKAVSEIYSVANGSKSDRIGFESYILSYYFNKVIINANIHLSQMSNKQYTLIIRQEKEKFGAYSGLELNVFDAHTGKQRDVNSLSGGESFKVALSLSLGLADITCEQTGSIEINTLFIDEGFGSLDSNSIESAIECLNSLRLRGRYIGIISHVNELKEKISAKINITKSPTGSHISSTL